MSEIEETEVVNQEEISTPVINYGPFTPSDDDIVNKCKIKTIDSIRLRNPDYSCFCKSYGSTDIKQVEMYIYILQQYSPVDSSDLKLVEYHGSTITFRNCRTLHPEFLGEIVNMKYHEAIKHIEFFKYCNYIIKNFNWE